MLTIYDHNVHDDRHLTGGGCTLHSHRNRGHRHQSSRRVRSSSHSDPLSYKRRSRKEVAERGVVVMVVLVLVVLVMVVLVMEVVVVLEVKGRPH